MFVYVQDPIDYHWGLLLSARRMVELIVSNSSPDCYENLYVFMERWGKSAMLARKAGWNGDFIEEPHIVFMPASDGCVFEYGFCFKQSEDGLVFTIVPFELPHLAEYLRLHAPASVLKTENRDRD